MAEGNFLMRLPGGFVEGDAAAPWAKLLKKGDATFRLRIEPVPSDRSQSPVADLAAPVAKALGGLELEGSGGARRLGRKSEAERTQLALFVRDGKRFYVALAEFPSGDEAEKEWRDVFEGFTLLDPKGAPEPVKADPEALKAKKLSHSFYKLTILKPARFAERPPDVDGDRGIWKHLRRVDENGDGAEIRVRTHLATASKLRIEDLTAAAMKRFENGYNSTRIPKKPKGWRVRGGKQGLQVQMAGKAKKTGIVVHADYRAVLHENGRIYEFDIVLFANAKRSYAKDLRAFWKVLKIKSKS